MVSIPNTALHREEMFYPDPDNYNPDNFNPEHVKKRTAYSFQAFGQGKCINI